MLLLPLQIPQFVQPDARGDGPSGQFGREPLRRLSAELERRHPAGGVAESNERGQPRAQIRPPILEQRESHEELQLQQQQVRVAGAS